VFDDGTHTLRFWYETWNKEKGKFTVARGIFERR